MELFSVFITGAYRGIGLEFVRQLVNLPSPPKHIFAADKKSGDSKDLKNIRNSSIDTKVHILKMDATNTNEIEATAKFVEEIVGEHGLTLLINNAGVGKPEDFPHMTKEMINFHFSENTIGPVMAMLAMLKRAASREKGTRMSLSRAGILNISSRCGSISDINSTFPVDKVYPAYKMSKAALNMAMREIAAKVKDDNILVIMMCPPSWVKTSTRTERGLLEPHENVGPMLSTAAKLSEFRHGTFMDRLGNQYPW